MPSYFKIVCALVCMGASCAVAQDAATPDQELARLSRELRETQSQLQSARQQIDELRSCVDGLRKLMEANHSALAAPPSAHEPTVAAADQDVSFLAAKIAEIHQDKVESTSKYPVKLSGLILFNSYWNRGVVDIQDLPSLTFQNFPGAPVPGIGGTLRQTMLGIDVTGPRIFGARSSANAEIDFAGGSPTVEFGVTNGLIRLRTARLDLDWKRTSLTIGQDAPFFSPLSPASYATVLEPALSWAGNLWVWTPEIEIEHRLPLNSSASLVLQGGLLDPLTEQHPPFQGVEATAGEASRVPAIAGRIALDVSHSRYPVTIGFGGYRAQQQYGTFPTVGSWTLNSDFKVDFGSHVQFSGEWYTGQAAGGLGGGIWTSVVYGEPNPPFSAIHAPRSTGGWAQVKLSPSVHFEINGAIGQDENFGHDLRFFPVSYSSYGFPALKKNRAEFVNFVYKPTSVLLFAVEYRHLFTMPSVGQAASAEHVNFAAGVRF